MAVGRLDPEQARAAAGFRSSMEILVRERDEDRAEEQADKALAADQARLAALTAREADVAARERAVGAREAEVTTRENDADQMAINLAGREAVLSAVSTAVNAAMSSMGTSTLANPPRPATSGAKAAHSGNGAVQQPAPGK